MKKFKFNHELLFYYLSAAAILLLLSIFIPEILIKITYANWLFLIGTIYLWCSAKGSIQLEARLDVPKSSLTRCVIQVIFLQLLLSITFLGFFEPLAHYFLANQINSPAKLTLHQFYIQWGIYPFAMYGLVACLINASSTKETIKNLCQLLPSKNSNLQEGFILYLRQGLFWVVALSAGISLIVITKDLTTLFHLPFTTGPSVNTLIICSVILLLCGTKTWHRLTKNSWKRHTPLNLTLIGLVFLVPFIIIVINILVAILTLKQQYALPYSNLLYKTISQHAHTFFFMLIWLWWLGWTPLVANRLIRIFAGRSGRTLIMANFLLPMLVGIVYFTAENTAKFSSSFIRFSNLWHNSLLSELVISLISLFTLCLLIRSKNTFQQLILSSISDLPATDHQRLPINLLRGILQSVLLVSVLGMLGGIWGVYIISTGLMMMLFVLFCLITLRYLVTF